MTELTKSNSIFGRNYLDLYDKIKFNFQNIIPDGVENHVPLSVSTFAGIDPAIVDVNRL